MFRIPVCNGYITALLLATHNDWIIFFLSSSDISTIMILQKTHGGSY